MQQGVKLGHIQTRHTTYQESYPSAPRVCFDLNAHVKDLWYLIPTRLYKFWEIKPWLEICMLVPLVLGRPRDLGLRSQQNTH